MCGMAKSLDLREFGYPLFESESEACKYFGISVGTFIYRRNHGMSVIDALTTKKDGRGSAREHKSKPIIIEGKQYSSRAEACKAYGVSLHTVNARQQRNKISFEEALVKPIQKHTKGLSNPVEIDGITVYSYDDACNKFGISRPTLHYRMNNLKMTFEEALKYRPNTKVMFNGCKLYKHAGKFFMEIAGYSILDTYDSDYKMRYFKDEMMMNPHLKICILNTNKKDDKAISEVDIETVELNGYKAYKIRTTGEVGSINIKIQFTRNDNIIAFNSDDMPYVIDNNIVKFTVYNIIKLVSIVGDFELLTLYAKNNYVNLDIHSSTGEHLGVLRYNIEDNRRYCIADFVVRTMDSSKGYTLSSDNSTSEYIEIHKSIASKWRVYSVIYNLPYMRVLNKYTKFKTSYTNNDIIKILGNIPCRTMMIAVDDRVYLVDILNKDGEYYIQYIRYSYLSDVIRVHIARYKLSCNNDVDLEILNLIDFINNYSKKTFKILEKETRHIKNINSIDVVNIAPLDEEFREIEVNGNRVIYKYTEKPVYNHTDRKQSPHPRSGYTRNQRYGKGRELVKQVRIEPTYINGKKDDNGDSPITIKTYR